MRPRFGGGDSVGAGAGLFDGPLGHRPGRADGDGVSGLKRSGRKNRSADLGIGVTLLRMGLVDTHRDGVLQPLQVPDADVLYAAEVDLGAPYEALLSHLIGAIPWRSESIVLWGKRYVQPRLIAWYGDGDASYTYSGLTLTPLRWTPTLIRLKEHVERLAQTTFNSVLLNYYRNGQDSMGFHSDDEPELGPAPIIASLSLGDPRTFVLKHKTRKQLRPLKMQLTSGSLLLMRGDTQRNWRHAVEKETRPCGPRINLTFRRIVQPVQ